MLHRVSAALAALVVCVLPAASQEARPAAAPRLDQLFTTAQRDPAGVVPLLIEGSRTLATLAPADAQRLGDTLEPFARRAFFTPERLPGMERLGLVEHTVAKGENPTVIASRYDIGPGLLNYLNRDLDPKRLKVGDRLKVLDLSRGQLELDVDRSTYRLAA